MAFSEQSTTVQHPTWTGTKENTAYWDGLKKNYLRKTYIPKCMEMAQKKISCLYAHCPMKATSYSKYKRTTL